jgi:hypothetical protein
MREVFKVPGYKCDGCVHTGVNEWNDLVCYAEALPIVVRWSEKRQTCRHPTCPFHGPVRVTMEDDAP